MPDFATMDRKALRTFRENATKRNERPTVENNYLTMKFSMERRSQPADWVSTCIATKWCEHHGPSGHTTDNCEKLAAMKKGEPKKKVQKPKKSMAAYYKQLEEDFIKLKQVQRMKKRAAADNTAGKEGPAAKKRRN